MTLDLDAIERRAKALYEQLYALEPGLSNYEMDYLLRGAIPGLIARVRELETEVLVQQGMRVVHRLMDEQRPNPTSRRPLVCMHPLVTNGVCPACDKRLW